MKLNDVRIDGGTQARVSINEAAVAEYADAMEEGAKLPPVVVFLDGTDYWLADGFHRYHAHRKIGAVEIDVDVREGTASDAKLFAYGANQSHGLRRTNEDKKKAVDGMLADFADWCDRRIARHVGVSDKTVAAHRGAICGNSADAASAKREVLRGGRTYKQDTAGQKKAGAVKAGKKKPEAQAVDNTTSAVDPEEYSDKDYKIDNLRGALDAISEENDELKQRVAVECMDATEEDKLLAHNLITELRKQVKQLTLELHATQSTRNSYMVENGELKKTVAHWRRQAEKAKAAAARPGKVGG